MILCRPDDFAGQFLLGPSPVTLPGARSVALPSLHLAVVAPLETRQVETEEGTPLGILLGRPIDLDRGAFLGPEVVLPDPAGEDIDIWVEREIYRFGGSFLFVLDYQGIRRVYLDACGSRSAVYDPETGLCGATTPALLDTAELERRFDGELYAHLDVDREGWFTGDLTAHQGVHRLLPNHYLDLDNCAVQRHWPLGGLGETQDPEGACADIVTAARATFKAALAVGEGSVGLTAGTETRFLTAVARPHLERLQFVTVRAKGAERDIWCAGELAQRFNLKHSFLPIVMGDEANAMDWQARAGYCMGGPHRYTRRSIEPLKAREFFIGGQAGEVGRGFFWRPEDRADTPITPAILEARLGMRSHPRVTAALSQWLEGLPDVDTYTLLDLAYIELRMGSWAFALSYCDPTPDDIFPMISRRSFVAMMTLPAAWRHDKERMIRVSIGQAWPELLELPFNAYGDFRDKLALIRKAISQPHLVAKKLRKMLG